MLVTSAYLELEIASSKALISNSLDLTKEFMSSWPPLSAASVDCTAIDRAS